MDDFDFVTADVAGDLCDCKRIYFEPHFDVCRLKPDRSDVVTESPSFEGDEFDVLTLGLQLGGQGHQARDRTVGGCPGGADLQDVQLRGRIRP